MATAYVAGVVAYYIDLEGNISPGAMTAKLQSHCLKGVLTGIRESRNIFALTGS